jgi:hypothetical protein
MATKKKEISADAVAVYSLNNIHWSSVGKITKGYNIVSKEEAEKWVTHKSVRLATPEEVASFYGKHK